MLYLARVHSSNLRLSNQKEEKINWSSRIGWFTLKREGKVLYFGLHTCTCLAIWIQCWRISFPYKVCILLLIVVVSWAQLFIVYRICFHLGFLCSSLFLLQRGRDIWTGCSCISFPYKVCILLLKAVGSCAEVFIVHGKVFILGFS